MWGYYLAGGFLLFCAAVIYMFACVDRLNRRSSNPDTTEYPQRSDMSDMSDASETVYVFRCATCGGPAAHDTEDHDRLTENPCDSHVHGPLTTNERILMASLTRARRSLAAVEALAHDWENAAKEPMPERGEGETAQDQGVRIGVWHSVQTAARLLRAALRAAPSEATTRD